MNPKNFYARSIVFALIIGFCMQLSADNQEIGYWESIKNRFSVFVNGYTPFFFSPILSYYQNNPIKAACFTTILGCLGIYFLTHKNNKKITNNINHSTKNNNTTQQNIENNPSTICENIINGKQITVQDKKILENKIQEKLNMRCEKLFFQHATSAICDKITRGEQITQRDLEVITIIKKVFNNETPDEFTSFLNKEITIVLNKIINSEKIDQDDLLIVEIIKENISDDYNKNTEFQIINNVLNKIINSEKIDQDDLLIVEIIEKLFNMDNTKDNNIYICNIKEDKKDGLEKLLEELLKKHENFPNMQCHIKFSFDNNVFLVFKQNKKHIATATFYIKSNKQKVNEIEYLLKYLSEDTTFDCIESYIFTIATEVALFLTNNMKDGLIQPNTTAISKERLEKQIQEIERIDRLNQNQQEALTRYEQQENQKKQKMIKECEALIKQANEYGVTPFFMACVNGNVEALEYFIKNNSNNINKKCTHTELTKGESLTPLQFVINETDLSNQVELTKILLSKKADVTTLYDNGDSCLIRALQKSHLGPNAYDIIDLVLQQDIDVNYINPNNGKTALMIAEDPNTAHRKCFIERIREKGIKQIDEKIKKIDQQINNLELKLIKIEQHEIDEQVYTTIKFINCLSKKVENNYEKINSNEKKNYKKRYETALNAFNVGIKKLNSKKGSFDQKTIHDIKNEVINNTFVKQFINKKINN